jgi:hypothetical protein
VGIARSVLVLGVGAVLFGWLSLGVVGAAVMIAGLVGLLWSLPSSAIPWRRDDRSQAATSDADWIASWRGDRRSAEET